MMNKKPINIARHLESETSKHILLVTTGSYGDVFPFLALAQELQIRGHRVVLASTGIYRHIVEPEGIEFHAIRPDGYNDLEQLGQFIQLLSNSQQPLDYGISYLMMPHLRATYSDLVEVAHKADLLVTHPLACAATLVAEKMGIKRISTVLSPISFLSAYDSPYRSITPSSDYETALTLVAKDNFYRQLRWQTRFWSAPVRQLRAELDLQPSADLLFEGQHSSELVLALFSQVLASPQPDWPIQTQVTGFPFFTSCHRKGLPKELEDFLQYGPPPIVFTLGSLMVWAPGNFYFEGAIAAQQLGYRCVLLMGAGANAVTKEQLPPGACAIDYAPHEAIFPRAAAIVHHGGVGTTAQALRAGRPMLVIPQAFDQPDNAARLVRLGVARMLERQHGSASHIATELKPLLLDKNYAAKAAEVSRIVQAENGVVNACDAIESHLLLRSI
ncbi:MAG: glycosyltransferase [Gloeotrichia echinulata HAB0833]